MGYTYTIETILKVVDMKKMIMTLLAVSLFSVVSAKPNMKDASVISSASAFENSVKLQWAQSGTVEVKMFTPRGQLITKTRMTITAGSESLIPLTEISTGVYYVTVNTGRSIQKTSFVK